MAFSVASLRDFGRIGMIGWVSVPGDLRRAFRSLARRRTFAVSAVLTLALAFSIPAVVLSTLDRHFWRPLDLPESDRLFTVQIRDEDGYFGQPRSSEHLPLLREMGAEAFSLAAFESLNFTMVAGGAPTRVDVARCQRSRDSDKFSTPVDALLLAGRGQTMQARVGRVVFGVEMIQRRHDSAEGVGGEPGEREQQAERGTVCPGQLIPNEVVHEEHGYHDDGRGEHLDIKPAVCREGESAVTHAGEDRQRQRAAGQPVQDRQAHGGAVEPPDPDRYEHPGSNADSDRLRREHCDSHFGSFRRRRPLCCCWQRARVA